MSKKILVAYASQSGSTAGVAEMIGKTLAEDGMEVDVCPISHVTDVSGYDAFVLGSAVHGQKWLPEAMQFIKTHRAVLSQKPFATFTVCITLAMSNSDLYRQAVAAWIQPVRAQVKPVSEGLFAGMLDFNKLPLNWDTLKLRAVVALGIFPKDDRRDWNAIRAWAESIHPLLLQ